MADKKVEQIDDDDVQEADVGRILESTTFVLVQDENDRNVSDDTQNCDESIQESNDNLKSNTKVVDNRLDVRDVEDAQCFVDGPVSA